MSKKQPVSLLKHIDFVVLDMAALQICFVLAFWVVHGLDNPYAIEAYRYQGAVLFASQIIVILFDNNLSGILKRKRYDEALAVVKYILKILVVSLIILFLVHETSTASRLQFGLTSVFFVVVDFFFRYVNKLWIIRSGRDKKRKRSIVLVTSGNLVKEAMEKLNPPDAFYDFFISSILLFEGEETDGLKDYGIPVRMVNYESLIELSHSWVDEIFILMPDNIQYPIELINTFMGMGLTVNFTVSALCDEASGVTDMQRLGTYKVLVSGVNPGTPTQLVIKRLMDIAGALVGCVITAVIGLIIGPIIYHKSPGPIFFVQNRIGQNGKIFRMYKFRSMYMDAEERKAELMAMNKIKDGMMFKMDDDPRIIGSEKKDKKGRPRGIGNFIRNTSIDEFPQFFNVLKGDMSLVGWRPATLDEWTKYNLKHRIRASMKPGITGLWQVSGRSEITDFEEVVRLDREYLENWSLALDVKLLLKTIVVVFTRRGAK